MIFNRSLPKYDMKNDEIYWRNIRNRQKIANIFLILEYQYRDGIWSNLCIYYTYICIQIQGVRTPLTDNVTIDHNKHQIIRLLNDYGKSERAEV